MNTALGLRERKKLDTRWALSDAALELALERGLENVTREDIANRAGVSLRTFNNYFTGKYEAVAFRQVDRTRQSLAAFRERPADEPLWSAITEAMLAPLEAEGAADMRPTPGELAVIRDLLSARDLRAALTRDLLDRLGRRRSRNAREPIRSAICTHDWSLRSSRPSVKRRWRRTPMPIHPWPIPNSSVAALPMSRPDCQKGDADV